MLDFQKQLSLLPESLKEGYILLRKGYEPEYSTGICETLTCGFGELGDYGYFEYPIAVHETESRYLTIEEYLE